MRATAALLPAKNKFNFIYPIKGKWGAAATSMPKKQMDNDVGEGQMVKEKADPIVAFSKPPPLPPFLGPLIALSFLETCFSRDSNDD